MRRPRPPGAALFAVLAAAVLAVTSCGGSGRDAATATPAAGGHHGSASAGHEHGGSGHKHGGSGDGLTPEQDGFRLAMLQSPTVAGQQAELSFRITAPSGAPQTRFEVVHERLMHVFVVSKDLGDYHHVHPVMAPDGTWSLPLTLRRPGPYRLVADFVALDEQDHPHSPLVLGTDFELAGPYAAQPLPAPARETGVDGYAVRVDGDLVAGRTSMMTVRITQGAAPVTNLEPYLGALAHVAAFHEGDLQAVHLHPQEAPASDGGAPPSELMVHAEFPISGLYRMFIQFQTGARVHTAPITVAVQ